MTQVNCEKVLNFSGPHINATFVSDVHDYMIPRRSVVINPTQSYAVVSKQPHSVIAPLSSTILEDTMVHSAHSLLVVEVREPLNIGNLILEPGWALYWDLIKGSYTPPPGARPYPPDTPLWRSPQDDLGVFAMDPYAMTGQADQAGSLSHYLVRTNLWFAPSKTNCFIHNQHAFIEIHGQIFGRGRMQKFKTQDYAAIFEDQLMSPGYTTPVPFCRVVDEHSFTYPWHQYFADTDCVWIAIEYHPTV